MNFKKISISESILLANDNNELYTSCEAPGSKFYIYRDVYISSDIVHNLSFAQMDGLTPINPNKPMFPKK